MARLVFCWVRVFFFSFFTQTQKTKPGKKSALNVKKKIKDACASEYKL